MSARCRPCRRLVPSATATASTTGHGCSEPKPDDAAGRGLRHDVTAREGHQLGGDCMTYAVAELAEEPLLCLGDDFSATDLELA